MRRKDEMVSHRTGTGTEEFKLREVSETPKREIQSHVYSAPAEDMIQFREFDKPDSDRVTEY